MAHTDVLRFLIVDDEPIAHQVILNMCQSLEFMQHVGSCYHALEAMAKLQQQAVDVLFLDIQLPQLGGFEFLRTLKSAPQVVVISAHSEYALEGYDLNVTDYLLKPFSLERFLKAINKVRGKQMGEALEEVGSSQNALFVKDGKRHYQVQFEDILYLKACGNYTEVHLQNGELLAGEKISELEARLPTSFLRVHKSYVVSTRKIALVEGNEILVGRISIPIGRVYKSNISKLLRDGGLED